MRVLMFGWEFPPHISGGLGTACHGLAHALVDNHVDVLFVVPKLSGEEVSAAVKMISASEIDLPGIPMPAVDSHAFERATNSHHHSVDEEDYAEQLSATLHVQATSDDVISPYNYGDGKYSIQQWNYQFSDHVSSPQSSDTEFQDILQESILPALAQKFTRRHRFSGQYGKDLILEVELYSHIAEVIAEQNQHDVIHAHDWISFPAGIAAKRISGKPLVMHVHATEFDRSGDNVNPAVFNFERDGMLQADKVLTVSQWTRQIVINKYGIPAEKVEVVYNGIVAKKTNNIPDLPLLGSHIVTFLGRITHQKGPFYFVEAARLVLEKFPDAHFVVAGSGDLLPAMIEHVAEHKISSRFHFTGFVKGENLDKIWSVTNVYVMPSVSEPFGLTPLEAMQSGIPVIISKQSGVSEVMKNALKVDFWDIRKLASAICSVLHYKGLTEELKLNSEAEIETINWDRSAKKINHLYHELTNRKEEYEDPSLILSDPSAQKTSIL